MSSSKQPMDVGRDLPTWKKWQTAPPEKLAERKMVRARRGRAEAKSDAPAGNAGGFPTQRGAPAPRAQSASTLQAPADLAPLTGPGGQARPKATFDPSKIDLDQSVSEAGLWQMTEGRKKQLAKQLTVFLGTTSPSNKVIRIAPSQEGKEQWGLSADENARTAFQRVNRAKMGKQEAKAVYNQRSHQGFLVWSPGSESLTQYGEAPDDKEPVSSHTPGLKWEKTGGTRAAITKEHGRRDKLRALIVAKTFADDKREPYDTALISRAATLQLLAGPKEELKAVHARVKQLKKVISVFADIGNIAGSREAAFDKFVDRLQTVREIDKMMLSRNLLAANRPIHPEHRKLLDAAGGDIRKAMELLHESSKDSKAPFNDAKRSVAPRLDQESLRTMGKPPLSPPRRIVTPVQDIQHFTL